MAHLGTLDFDMTLRNEKFLEALKKSKAVSEETVKEIERMMSLDVSLSKQTEGLDAKQLRTLKQRLSAEKDLAAIRNRNLKDAAIVAATEKATADKAIANAQRVANMQAESAAKVANVQATSAAKTQATQATTAARVNAINKASANKAIADLQRVANLREKNARDAEMHAARMAKAQAQVDAQTNNANKRLGSQNAILRQLKTAAASYLSVWGAVSFVKNLAKISGEFELQERSLAAIIQSSEKAHEIFGQIKELAVISPFEVKHLMSYAKQLSAFSEPVKDLFETTSMLADVSAGLGVDMNRIILAYGQVRSAAVLRGQELRQFTEAGIPLVAELAKKFTELRGEVVTTGQVFELISKRQVPFEMIREIFEDMTSEGGKFYQMQIIQSETLKGKINNLIDAYEIMLHEIGTANDGVLKGGVDSIRRLFENWEKVADAIKVVVAAYGAYKAALGIYWLVRQTALIGTQVIEWMKMSRALGAATANAVAFGRASTIAANPNVWAAVLSVITAIGVSIYNAHQNATRLSRELSEAAVNAEVTYNKNIGGLDKILDRLSKAERGTQDYRDAVKQLNRQYGEFLPYQIQVADSFDDITIAANAARTAMLQSARATAQARGEESIMDEFTKSVTGIYDDAVKTLNKKPSFLSYAILGDKAEAQRVVSNFFEQIREGALKNADKMGVREALLNELHFTSGIKRSVLEGMPQFDSLLDEMMKYKKEVGGLNSQLDDWVKTLDAVYSGTSDLQKEINAETEKYKSLLGALRLVEMSDDQFKKEAQKLELQHHRDVLAIYEKRGLANSDQARDIKEAIDTVEGLGVAWRDTAMQMAQADYSKSLAPTNDEHNLLEYIDRLRDEYKDLNEQIERYEGINKDMFDQDSLVRMRSQVKFLEDLFKVYGVSPDDPKSAAKKKKASDKEIKDNEKEVKKEIKSSIDRINTEIKEYSNRYDFYKHLLKRGRSKDEATDLSFGVNFEGEPNLIEHVKKQLQSLVGDKAELNLDLDFSVAQFDDIFKDMADKGLLSEEATKALRGLFDDLRALTVNESKVIDEMFDKYLGYTEKKAKLDAEYFTTREKFIKNGATAEVLENLLDEYKEAGNKLALEFKEDDIEFHTFVNSLAQKSIEQLRELLLKIDLEMSKMIDEGEDPETIAALRAKTVELEKELKEQVGKEKDKNVDSYGDWRKLTTVLSKVKKELNSIGDSIGGVAGEAVNLAATLTTSTLEMIEGITNLADWSVKSTKDAAEGASKAIGMVEKASVVLAVISAAMQVLQAIMSEPEGGLSEYQRKLEEDRNALAREYNKILLERIAIEDKLFGGNKLQNFINVIDAYGEAARKLRALQEEETTVRDFYAPGRYAEYDATAREALRIRTKERNWLGKLIGRVDEYQNLEDYVRRVEGAELFNADGSLDLDIAKIVAQWDNLDDFSKKHLQDLIAAQEAFEEYSESMSQFIDETYGKLGDSLTNALVESFRNGSMAAEDFKKDVTDVLEDVAAQMVRMLFLQDFIDEYKQEISKAYEDYASHGDEAIFSDDIMRATSNFFNGMAQTSDKVDKFLQTYKDIGGKYGFDLFKPSDEDGGASQLSRQISGIREDQADQLGSYLNAIRDYTSRILIAVQQNSELYPSINTTLANCQLRLVEISANTLRSADNTDEIRKLLSAVVSGSKELHVT